MSLLRGVSLLYSFYVHQLLTPTLFFYIAADIIESDHTGYETLTYP